MFKNTKSFLYTLCGHFFIHYENTILAFVGPLIAHKFFPTNSDDFLNIYIAISAGYILRPFGAIFFSWIGDTFGRRPAIISGLAVLTFPGLIIGLLPEYDQVGITIPLIVIASRIIQGASIEGVFFGNVTFISETSTPKKVNINTGITISMGFVGALIGTGISIIFLHDSFPSWGWRIPFIFGGVVGCCLLLSQSFLKESEKWKNLKSHPKFPFLETLDKNPLNVLCVFIYGLALLVPFYVAVSWLPPILKNTFHTTHSFTLALISVTTFIGGSFIVLSAWACSYFNPKKIVYTAATAGIIWALCFYIMPHYQSLTPYIIFQLLAGVITGCMGGPVFIIVQSLFKVEYKYSGFAIPFSVGQALLVGTTPWISHQLTMRFDISYVGCFLWLIFAMMIVATKLARPTK